MPNSRDMDELDEESKQVDRIRQVARVMDDAITIPGTNIRIGLDPLIGLIPGVGDVTGAAINGWIIVTAGRLGASPAVLARMLANAGIDALFGAIPFLGDLFDFGFKAHRRNLKVLEAHLADPRAAHRRSTLVLAAAGGGVVALLTGLILLTGWALAGVFGALTG
jgi:hypothetical protein